MSLASRSAIVTGGGSGIGASLTGSWRRTDGST